MIAKNAAQKIMPKVVHTAVVAALALSSGFATAAATIVINNINGPNVGFNDPTPVAPVGGNTGTTLGQQRLNAFQAAASIWGATLSSAVPIIINAQFTALTCSSSSAVLGSAGANTIESNFTNAPVANTWYPQALANKLAGVDLEPAQQDINANFNVNLGQTGCLDGTFFYLGLDNNHGTNIDLVSVLLHEFGHGLGFQTFTSGSTGAQISGLPSIWDGFLLDTSTSLTWKQMTNAQRVASAINTNNLVWSGANVTAAVPTVLAGTPRLQVTSPASIAGNFAVGTAGFGPPLTNAGVTRQIMPVINQGAGPGCDAFNAVNTAAVANKIALIDRGTCTFVVKVKNAQNAGAVGVVIANNAAGPAPGLGGSDPTITIPTVSVSQADGVTIKAALATRSRTASSVVGGINLNAAQLAGANSAGQILMYAPNPFQGGSSVSHYDVSALPNQLMEPAINGDLTHSVTVPQDLTFKLLQDIGW
jgi:hypothetical protein